jgi:hypothetical protein
MLRTRIVIVSLAIGLAPVTSGTLSAQEQPPIRQAQAIPHDPANCYCRAKGRTFAEGESACLATPQGWRMAECLMVTNLMSWGFTERTCPET